MTEYELAKANYETALAEVERLIATKEEAQSRRITAIATIDAINLQLVPARSAFQAARTAFRTELDKL